ncbi:hypothetical protein PR202_ga07113 [Eleusine coracana subsp. coracana]|uniref:Bifunctional inhibitor/plant lipid transfer protein/seed storage helical domain-containing protein n=1 Tax=Eleusine coracana subsp. coracana TaxID=191504 RepID=A0AAV5BYF9_ELECO|nr:hypothetical protein PR202_ga07113 [Eleusine coracana subsp. coracana]
MATAPLKRGGFVALGIALAILAHMAALPAEGFIGDIFDSIFGRRAPPVTIIQPAPVTLPPYIYPPAVLPPLLPTTEHLPPCDRSEKCANLFREGKSVIELVDTVVGSGGNPYAYFDCCKDLSTECLCEVKKKIIAKDGKLPDVACLKVKELDSCK